MQPGKGSAPLVVATGVAGLAIGWLVGLAISPVVAAVIATLLAAVAAIAGGTASAGGQSKVHVHVSPLPMVALVLGIAIGATVGMEYRMGRLWAREPATTTESPEAVLQRWVALGANKADVIERLLDRDLPMRGPPIGAAVKVAAAAEPAKGAVPIGLVAGEGSPSICADLRRVDESAILRALSVSNSPPMRALAAEVVQLQLPTTFAVKLRDALCVVD